MIEKLHKVIILLLYSLINSKSQREIKLMALKKFDTDQCAEVMCYSIGMNYSNEL
jgi:hypothetical protein